MGLCGTAPKGCVERTDSVAVTDSRGSGRRAVALAVKATGQQEEFELGSNWESVLYCMCCACRVSVLFPGHLFLDTACAFWGCVHVTWLRRLFPASNSLQHLLLRTVPLQHFFCCCLLVVRGCKASSRARRGPRLGRWQSHPNRSRTVFAGTCHWQCHC